MTRYGGVVKLQEAPQALATPTGLYTTSPAREIVMPSKGSIPRVCVTCGETFFTYPVRVRQGRAHFCSTDCRREGQRGSRGGDVEILDDGTARVPLRARDGSIKAYALIDAADADLVNQWRWYLARDGYATRVHWNDGAPICFRLHRELLGLSHGDEREGDHINRDRLDCRRSNLRALPRRANSQNQPSFSGSTSKYRGVHWSKSYRKWAAVVVANGEQHRLGYFGSEEEAAEVARAGRARLLPYAVD